jgi:hypothetical protein
MRLVLIIPGLSADFEARKPKPMLGNSQNHGRITVAIPKTRAIHI